MKTHDVRLRDVPEDLLDFIYEVARKEFGDYSSSGVPRTIKALLYMVKKEYEGDGVNKLSDALKDAAENLKREGEGAKNQS